ncbi:hypothetical protein E2542_SST12418 [Spatholobus suberectus]|nr:hypothetical protein E2542_SST12418 [Spatholobus suberectus]
MSPRRDNATVFFVTSLLDSFSSPGVRRIKVATPPCTSVMPLVTFVAFDASAQLQQHARLLYSSELEEVKTDDTHDAQLAAEKGLSDA